jgi:thymidine kinase
MEPTAMTCREVRCEVYLAPMFAGKSTACLKLARQLQHAGLRVMLVKPRMDTRSSELTTHDGDRASCLRVEQLEEIFIHPTFAECRAVLIDEAQFIPDLVDGVKGCIKAGRDVHVFGLNGDAKQRPIGHILEVIPLANRIHDLRARCIYCGDGTEASFTRVNAPLPADGVLIGGAETYAPVCRNHIE